MSHEMEEPAAADIRLAAAYVLLMQMRDHLRFLARLTLPRDDEDDAPEFRAESLVWCFSCLASDVDTIATALRSSVHGDR